jgi:uncharacterized membrane protein YqaE (UPF0057 family)
MLLPAPREMSERTKAFAMAYLCFFSGAVAAWLRGGNSAELNGALCMLAIIWFPGIIVALFRRFGISNYGVAAAILSGICGYDGISRLLHPFHSGC